MTDSDLALIAIADLAGHLRGRAFSAGQMEARLDSGVGWVPANMSITAFGETAACGISGPLGDLRLRPDPAATIRLDPIAGGRGLRVTLADIVNLDLTPWSCCLRNLLRRALAALEAEFGLSVHATFEHEFTMLGPDGAVMPQAGQPFTVGVLRSLEPFGSALFTALEAAGFEPDTWLAEYGPNQFEITLSPCAAGPAADRALLLRELVRDLARQHGRRASFAPLIRPQSIGNGVHVHFSLRDAAGRPVLHDPSAAGGLSAAGASFAAGILAHSSAICALTAPSVVSYLRMRPHTWSAAHVCLGLRNRETMLRICPTTGSSDIAAQYNLEYRAADATANPWLVMAALVIGGLDGLRTGRPGPVVIDGDLGTWTQVERAAAGVGALPGSLGEAVQALADDQVFSHWLGSELLGTYQAVKGYEIAALEGASAEAICERYMSVY